MWKKSSSIALAATLLVAGCHPGPATGDGAPRLTVGEEECAVCGMPVNDPGFAAASRNSLGEVEWYDSIECLITRLRRSGRGGDLEVWLADRASPGALYDAKVMTVVLANYPSPMGKGYAAFHDQTVLQEEVRRRGGVAGPLQDFVDGTLKPVR